MNGTGIVNTQSLIITEKPEDKQKYDAIRDIRYATRHEREEGMEKNSKWTVRETV